MGHEDQSGGGWGVDGDADDVGDSGYTGSPGDGYGGSGNSSNGSSYTDHYIDGKIVRITTVKKITSPLGQFLGFTETHTLNTVVNLETGMEMGNFVDYSDVPSNPGSRLSIGASIKKFYNKQFQNLKNELGSLSNYSSKNTGQLLAIGAGAALMKTGSDLMISGCGIMAVGGPVGWVGGGIVTVVGATTTTVGALTTYEGFKRLE